MRITKISEQFGEYLYHRLPKVYRDYDVAIDRKVKNSDGTEDLKRFYTLEEYIYSFAEGGFQPLLEDLEAIITLIDPMSCPEEFLPMFLQHFGLDFIEDIPVKFQRRLVQNIVTLYRKKGTIPAVAFLARELSGFDVTIEETERGGIEFALVKLNAYENEDAELLLAQEVVQRYIHLFLPAQAKAEIVVTYGFTEGIHINSKITLENYKSKDIGVYGNEYDHVRYDVDEDDDSHVGFVWDEYFFEESDFIQRCVDEDFYSVKISHGLDDTEFEDFSFYPFDISSLTNVLEEGDFVYTNGTCCEDTIITNVYADEDRDGTLEFTYPNETRATISKLGGNSVKSILPVAKVTTDLKCGELVRLDYKDNYYYWRCTKDLYGSHDYPITLVLCLHSNTIKVFCQYETIYIDENSILRKNVGYNSFRCSLDVSVLKATSTDSNFKVTNCIISSDGFYGNSTKAMYVRVDETFVDISYSGITTVENMLSYLRSNPITIHAPVAVDSCCGTYMEKYLETCIPDSYDRSITCNIVTDSTKLSSYPSVGFMRSTKVSVTDGDGLTSTYNIPLELLSLNGKHDYIEKVGSRYFHHHWVDKFNMEDFAKSSYINSTEGDPYSSTMFRFYTPQIEGYPYYPIDSSDMRNNLYCDFGVITPDTLTYSGKTDLYERRYFRTSGWLTQRVAYADVDLGVKITLYSPKITGTISCEEGKTLTVKVLNTTDNTTIENRTITHADGKVNLSYSLPSLLRSKAYSVEIICVDDSDKTQLLNASVKISTGLTVSGKGTIFTSNNSDVDIHVSTVGTDLIDKQSVIKGAGALGLEIPNILISASAQISATGYENIQVESSDDSTYHEYTIEACNGNFMRRLNTTDYNAQQEASQLNMRDWQRFIKDTDIIPNFYYVRSEERVEEILDKVVLNKLNLLPIPDIYAKIYSKDIPFSEIEISAESKIYY